MHRNRGGWDKKRLNKKVQEFRKQDGRDWKDENENGSTGRIVFCSGSCGRIAEIRRENA